MGSVFRKESAEDGWCCGLDDDDDGDTVPLEEVAGVASPDDDS